MKIAIIGSRDCLIEDFSEYLPKGVTEIVSGGARGIDSAAAAFAHSHGLPVTEFLPDYKSLGRGAPLARNKQIVEYSDEVLAFWNGVSRGTKFVIDYCARIGRKCTVIRL